MSSSLADNQHTRCPTAQAQLVNRCEPAPALGGLAPAITANEGPAVTSSDSRGAHCSLTAPGSERWEALPFPQDKGLEACPRHTSQGTAACGSSVQGTPCGLTAGLEAPPLTVGQWPQHQHGEASTPPFPVLRGWTYNPVSGRLRSVLPLPP